MVSGWHTWTKHRKIALQATLFLIVVVVVSVIIRSFFPNIDHNGPGKGEAIKNGKDTVKSIGIDTLK